MKRLGADELVATAQLYRAAYDDRLPWLAGRHTAAEDLEFFRSHVFQTWALWGEFDDATLVGFIAMRPGWIEQLYVLPQFQRRGIGGRLVDFAKSQASELQLWTFGKNAAARRFYERGGFSVVRFTDGMENEEHEPDVLYRWVKTPAV